MISVVTEVCSKSRKKPKKKNQQLNEINWSETISKAGRFVKKLGDDKKIIKTAISGARG